MQTQIDDVVLGCAPVLVDRLDGSVHSTGTAKSIEGYVDRYENATRCKVLGLPEMSEYSGRKSAFRATRKSGVKESDSDVAVRCRAGCLVVRRQLAERGGLRRRTRMLELRRPTNLVFRSTAEPPD